MISVVIPAQNAALTLPAVFQSLFEAAMDGLVSEVIVCDCGSTDATPEIADAAGAMVIQAGCGQQLLAGAQAARKPWLLFLHADALLQKGWEDEVRTFIASGKSLAAIFRVQLDNKGMHTGLRGALGGLRNWAFGLSRKCPALLIHVELLDAAGIASISPIDEADFLRRFWRGRAFVLGAAAILVNRRRP